MFVKPKRPVSRIFIHCTAYGRGDLKGKALLNAVDSWHKARGWDKVGYHYLIDRDGLLIPTYRGLEEKPIAQANNNTGTIAICLDGLAITDFNAKQFATLRALADDIDAAYLNLVHYHGHCEVANKACPVFDYKAVLGLDAAGYRHPHTSIPIVPAPTVSDVQPTASNVRNTNVTTSYNLGIRILHRTAAGQDVAWIQKQLDIKDDGLFGQKTYDAIVAYQKKHNLFPDGIVGKNTWKQLIFEFNPTMVRGQS
jgi:N-acetyl-anhydromuramyl-L-alanine amidase AmpD